MPRQSKPGQKTVKQTKRQSQQSQCDRGKLLRRRKVAERIDTSEEYVRLANDPNSPYYIPDFPVPIRIGKNIVAYVEAELLDWISKCERVEKRIGGDV